MCLRRRSGLVYEKWIKKRKLNMFSYSDEPKETENYFSNKKFLNIWTKKIDRKETYSQMRAVHNIQFSKFIWINWQECISKWNENMDE